MIGVLFKIIFLVLGAFLICFAAGQAFRNARRLDRRIAEFKAEQKEMEEQGRSVPPFMALSELYMEENKEVKNKKR